MNKHLALTITVLLIMAFACPMLAGSLSAPVVEAAGDTDHWVKQESGTNANLTGVTAGNSETACAVGANGTVLLTRDRGQTWREQPRKTTSPISAVSSVTSNLFWYIGNTGSDNFLYYSTDGAATWQSGWIKSTNTVRDICMENDKVGWICGDPDSFMHSSTAMWGTSDGKNFNDQDWWGSDTHVISVSAWDTMHAIAVALVEVNGTFYPYSFTTTNGGKDWGDRVQLPLHWIEQGNIRAVRAIPGTKKAIAVGRSGGIYSCDNYGLKDTDWRNISGISSWNFNDVDALDEKQILGVGDDGLAMWLGVSGDNNKLEDTPTDENLRSVSLSPNNTAWAVGDHGTILYEQPPAVITSCQPAAVTQGDSVLLNITGSDTHFRDGVSFVQFSGDGIDVISTSIVNQTVANVQIKVVDNATPGARDVNILTPATEFPNRLRGGLTIKAKPALPPRLDSIDPPQGWAGTYVTLKGAHFGAAQGQSYVAFAGGATATELTQWTDAAVTCAVPASAVSGDVKVHTLLGDSNGVHFDVSQPKVPSIVDTDPNSIKQGETGEITITGQYTHFGTGSSAVFTPADGITVNYTSAVDSNTAKAGITVGRNAPPGTRDVNVLSGPETPVPMAGGLAVQRRDLRPPVLSGISPTSGAVSDRVTLSGQNFGSERGQSRVSFTGADAIDYAAWSDGAIECLVPPGAQSGPVTVTTEDGTSGGEAFVVGSPAIETCSPQSAVQGSSVDVDVLGDFTHFASGDSRAVFSGTGIDVRSTTVWDATHATATIAVAGDAAPGFRDLSVLTGGEIPAPLHNVFRVRAAPPAKPQIRSIQPGSGRVGTTVTVNGADFGQVRGNSEVRFNSRAATRYLSWSDTCIVCTVPFGASTGNVQVATPWGAGTGPSFEVKEFAYYFAEGTTRPGFASYFAILNPDDDDAKVKITYMTGAGKVKTQYLTIKAHSRHTVRASDVLGSGDGPAFDFSAKVECTNGQEIVAERPMYFDYQGFARDGWTGGHDAIGMLEPQGSLLLAEGTTRPGFEPYLTIQNPDGTDAQVTVTYVLGDSTKEEQKLVVPARSRSTVAAFAFLGGGNDFSVQVDCTTGEKIVVERPMYFDYQGAWTGGSDAMGIPVPGTSFNLAEGTTRPGFDSFITLQNPGKAYARVKITYYTGSGGVQEQIVNVAPGSRYTVNVKDFLGSGDEPAYDFSATIKSLAGQEIVVERPMYFNYKGAWNGGHDVVASQAASTNLYFAEGSCRPDFRPYFTIMNPELVPAQVRIEYMLGDGTTKQQDLVVPARSRSTVPAFEFLGIADDDAHDFAAKVSCLNGQQIVVERPMYFNYGGAWDDGSNVMGFQAD